MTLVRNVGPLAFLILLAGNSSQSAENAGTDSRPNILLIAADDLGYADLGVYGSEIKTPNIDALAAQGILFTQYHTAPLCSLTRAMLMSGNNNHVAGVANQGPVGILGSPVPGYENSLSDRIMPFPKHRNSIIVWSPTRTAASC